MLERDRLDSFSPSSFRGRIVRICNKQGILKAEFYPDNLNCNGAAVLFLCLGYLQFTLSGLDVSEKFRSNNSQYYGGC